MVLTYEREAILQLCAANDDRCFTCGEKGHWQSMCTTQKPATVNELLFKAECCSNCGIPMKAVDGTQLHVGVAGKYCTFPRHFLEVGDFVVKFLSNAHALMLMRVYLCLQLTCAQGHIRSGGMHQLVT